MTNKLDHEAAIQLLLDTNFDNGWVVADGKLVLWEHEQDPPTPLIRPE